MTKPYIPPIGFITQTADDGTAFTLSNAERLSEPQSRHPRHHLALLARNSWRWPKSGDS